MLPSEEIANLGEVTMLVTAPFDLGSILPGKPLSELLLGFGKRLQRGLVPCDVKVFVQVVQHELKELFGVLLLIDGPHRVEVPANFLYLVREISKRI